MGNINDNSSGKPRAGFTPGEWRAEIARNSLGDTFDGYWLVNAPSERGVVGVADCFGEIRGVSDEDGDAHIADAEIKANAALIAAAPDLLAAAEIVFADLEARIDAAPDNAKPVFRGIADLWTAINKAKGLI